jgi:hypothetical protein
MPRFDSPLNNLSVASPCSADWEEMYGDDRKRFCGDCKLNVYNLSGMTQDEAETLVMNAEGRLCVRFYRRADGSVITADCPVGWAKVKQRTKVWATAVASLLMALFTGVLFVSAFSKQKTIVGKLAAIPFATPTPEYPVMGNIAVPTNTPSKPPRKKMIEVKGEVAPPPTDFEMGKMKVMAGERDSS